MGKGEGNPSWTIKMVDPAVAGCLLNNRDIRAAFILECFTRNGISTFPRCLQGNEARSSV